MRFSLSILWHERQRFLPALLAVAFSALLVALQLGLLLGTFSMVSSPVDHTNADVWVTGPRVVSVDVGHALPERWRARMDNMHEIEQTEPFIQTFCYWNKPGGGSEMSVVVGSRLNESGREQFCRRHLGFIFQGYNLIPALTARQQLEIVLSWGEGASTREARRRSEHMLSLLGLADKAHLRPGQLSGGQKQRVAIGRALVKNPSLCFADEPTSALDWAHGEEVIRRLRAIAREGRTTALVVSHDGRLIPYADRVLHLKDGCLTERHDSPVAVSA